MTRPLVASYALVRSVPATFKKCQTSHPSETPIDLPLARRQHGSYCKTLEALGLELIRVEPDDRFPDCCFVEDPAVVVGDTAIITRMGVPSRVGEEAALREALRPFHQIREILSPGTLEGGDVIQIDEKLFVGLTQRTNGSGLEQIDAIVSELGLQVIPVEVRRGLHLKSSCTYIGDDSLVLVPGHIDESCFSELNTIQVPPQEAPAADCLRIGGTVLILEGYPATKKLIEAEGFETQVLEMSEFEKCEGGLTCLSIVF